METLSESWLDEWGSVPLDSPEEEAAGLLDAYPPAPHGGAFRAMFSRLVAARRFLRLVGRPPLNAHGEPSVLPVRGKRKIRKVSVLLPPALYDRIRGAAPLDPERGIPWLRGLLGGCGFLYLPRNGYYFSFRLPKGSGAETFLGLLLSRRGYPFSRRIKSGALDFTLRDRGEIVRLLARVGLERTARRLEETAAIRSMKDRANRLVNCDSANIEKSVLAAGRQLALSRTLEEMGRLGDLPEPYREVVEARLANPSGSLRELGASLTRPVGKSTVEYRWRKIELYVQSMMKGEGRHVLG